MKKRTICTAVVLLVVMVFCAVSAAREYRDNSISLGTATLYTASEWSVPDKMELDKQENTIPLGMATLGDDGVMTKAGLTGEGQTISLGVATIYVDD